MQVFRSQAKNGELRISEEGEKQETKLMQDSCCQLKQPLPQAQVTFVVVFETGTNLSTTRQGPAGGSR